MKVTLIYIAFLVAFLSGCCPDSDDVDVAAETKGWIPYQDGQMVTFSNDSLGPFSLRATLHNETFEQNGGKHYCQYKVERRILKLSDPASGAVTVQITLQSRDVYIGKTGASPNSDAIFNVNDNYQTVHGINAHRYEFISQVTLNGKPYQNVIHYSEGTISDPENAYQEYYFAKDHGMVAIKHKNNPATFHVN